MLSLDEIKNISFRRANFGGYKPEDVDNFIDEVESSYSKLLSEKSKLLKQVEELKKEVNKFLIFRKIMLIIFLISIITCCTKTCRCFYKRGKRKGSAYNKSGKIRS